MKGDRREIKPSEISSFAYHEWARTVGLDPEMMNQ